jgi:hypothetical protein
LSDFTSALKGSPYSISVDELSLFGHVIVEVEVGSVPTDKVLSGLKNIGQVAVEKSQTEGNMLLVTLDIPYPAGEWRPNAKATEWGTFQRNDFSSVQSRETITSQELPTYPALNKLLSANEAKLTNLKWSPDFWCRPLGAVKALNVSDEVAKNK